MMQIVGLLLLLFALSCLVSITAGEYPSTCNSTICVAPACVCSGTKVPYPGWTASDPPQIIALIFEGSLTGANYFQYKTLFDYLRNNPNNCPVSTTFFIDHKYTDYSTVHQAWLDGHDIAVQSITGESFNYAEYDKLFHEIKGESYYLEKFANLNSSYLQGQRAPQASQGSDNHMQAIVDSGLQYDVSLNSQKYRTPFWPYTFDYRTSQDCQNYYCPYNQYPGLWEFPITDLVDGNNNLCNNLFACIYNNSRYDARSLLQSNYEFHRNQSTPFLIPVPLAWLQDMDNLDGLRQFLNDAVTDVKKKAYVISLNRLLSWLKAPVKNSDIATFEPWLCDTPRSGTCAAVNCNYYAQGESINMGICSSKKQPNCPSSYPWIDNLPF